MTKKKLKEVATKLGESILEDVESNEELLIHLLGETKCVIEYDSGKLAWERWSASNYDTVESIPLGVLMAECIEDAEEDDWDSEERRNKCLTAIAEELEGYAVKFRKLAKG